VSRHSRFSGFYTFLFLLWATYLIVKGVDASGRATDSARASYLVGGTIVAALALLPRRRSTSWRGHPDQRRYQNTVGPTAASGPEGGRP
jgi:hypothetical protein